MEEDAVVYLAPTVLCGLRIPSCFKDANLEKAYVGALHRKMRDNVRVSARVGLACSILMICLSVWATFGDNEGNMQRAHLRVILSSLFVWIVFLLLAAFVNKLPWYSRIVGEAWLNCMMLSCCTCAMFLNRVRVAHFSGDSIDELWPRSSGITAPSDTFTVCQLSVSMMGFFSVPSRCSRTWPMVLLPMATYLLFTLPLPEDISAAEGSTGRRLSIALFLFTQSLLGYASSCKHEVMDRLQLFKHWTTRADLNKERVMRYTAEHYLDSKARAAAEQTDPEMKSQQTSGDDRQSSMLFQPVLYSNMTQMLTSLREVCGWERCEADAHHLELFPEQVLGHGAFGVVLAGKLYCTPVAIKVSRAREENLHPSSLQAFVSELRIVRHLRHPNIVAFHGACIDAAAGELALVYELVNGGSLESFDINLEGDPAFVLKLFICIARALRYLHFQKPSVVHGDLKPSNILLSRSPFQLKLADFGLSAVLSDSGKKRKLGGTARWMAPEVLVRSAADASTNSDVFSFGRVAFFICTGSSPNNNITASRMCELSKDPASFHDHLALDFPERSACRLTWQECLQWDPLMRPGIQQVQHDLWKASMLAKERAYDETNPFDLQRMEPLPPSSTWLQSLASLRSRMSQRTLQL
eukprot:TRINITY_DN36437_c0_g1_i2.p1 TRINITY_DN36437_c0_g1~~TRINITY_DN36437_c0_g1_i2.p1  ORF type:complete len:664 (+),score=101.98 TRINITY_DN36437_c0_g1_i2:76-1992(+)